MDRYAKYAYLICTELDCAEGNQPTMNNHAHEVDLLVARKHELRFFDEHPELEQQLAGEWVALDGEELIAHGHDLADVLQRASLAGHPHPFITRVPDPSVTFVF